MSRKYLTIKKYSYFLISLYKALKNTSFLSFFVNFYPNPIIKEISHKKLKRKELEPVRQNSMFTIIFEL